MCHRIKYLCEACGCVVNRSRHLVSFSCVCHSDYHNRRWPVQGHAAFGTAMQSCAAPRQEGLTRHGRSSTCASAASASGSQKVMSMARYSSMAVVSAARACSRWPIVAYSVPEAEVAVGLERAHAQFLGQGEGLAVVGLGWLDVWGLALRGNLAEEPQGLRLVASFLCGHGHARGPARRGRCASSRWPASRYASPRARRQSAW